MRVTNSIFSVFGLSIAAVLGVIASPAAADDDFPNELADREGATRLEPVSPWNIDFGTNRCRLGRMFGTEEERHLLMFEQAAPTESFGMTIAGPEVSNFRNSRRFFLGMERDEPMARRRRFARADIPDVGPAIILTTVSIGQIEPSEVHANAGLDLDEAATIDRIVLRRGSKILSFESGDMMPAFQALNTCTSDLLRAWGLEPDEHQSYIPPEWTNEAAITRRIVDNYPRSALNAGEQAIFRMRAIVEKDGSVSDCHLENSTEIERLESPACNAMMRARFEPARNAQGEPMRSFYATTVTYSLN